MVIADAENLISTPNEGVGRTEQMCGCLIEVEETIFLLKERTVEVGRDNLEIAQFNSDMVDLLSCITCLRTFFEDLNVSNVSDSSYKVKGERIYTGMKGQPRLDVSISEIEFLRELYFPWEKIAGLLGISFWLGQEDFTIVSVPVLLIHSGRTMHHVPYWTLLRTIYKTCGAFISFITFYLI